MIVKCQRSIESTELFPQMLFYTKRKSREAQYDLTPEWDIIFGPTFSVEKWRFFAEVKWFNIHTPPEFIKLVPMQDW